MFVSAYCAIEAAGHLHTVPRCGLEELETVRRWGLFGRMKAFDRERIGMGHGLL